MKGKKKETTKYERLHLTIKKEDMDKLRQLKKEKKIKFIARFAEDAFNEKLNPSKQDNSPVIISGLKAENEELRKKIENKSNESNYYYEKTTRKKYPDYESFLRNTEDLCFTVQMSSFPIIGWIYSILYVWIYLPLKYLFKEKESLYVKTEKRVLEEY